MRSLVAVLSALLLWLSAAAASGVPFTNAPGLALPDGVGDVNPVIDTIDTSGVFSPGTPVFSIFLVVEIDHLGR